MKRSIWKSTMTNWFSAILVLIVVMFMSAVRGLSQSPSSEHWSGSIQCQLDVEQEGYSRHEVQSWTLTGGELPPNGDAHYYGANWTATGRGALQKAQGSRTTIAQWAVSVPPMEAPLALFARNGKLHIRLSHSRKTLYNAVTGTRQISVNGVPQQRGPFTFMVEEWPLPWIDTTPGVNLSGTLTIQTAGIGGELPGAPVPAACQYQFTKTGAPGATPVSQNCPQVASIAQSFQAMKASLAIEFDGLIQQTQDPSRRAALMAQKQQLLAELDTVKEHNLRATAQTCEGTPGTNTAQKSGGSGARDTNTGQNSQGQGPAGSNSGQSGSGQSQTAGTQRSAAPQLLNITPSSVDQGTPGVQIVLVAQATNWQMNVTRVDFGPGISVTGPFVTKPNEAYALVSVASDAAPGPRSVSVITNNETVSLPTTFTVNVRTAGNQGAGITPAVNAMGGGVPRSDVEGGQPTFTAVPGTQSPAKNTPAPTTDVTGVQVTRNEAPTGTQVPTAPNSATNVNSLGKTISQVGRPTNQFIAVPTPMSSQASNQPPASGKYLVTMTGLWCAKATQDNPLDLDGHGDEVYAAAFVRKYDRTTTQNLLSFNRQTRVYGDSNQSDRIQAGTQTALGGIRAMDSIPNNATADRRVAPQDNSYFPYKLWGGTLTDGADALIISPSIWESDGKPSLFYQWNEKQNSVSSSMFLDTKVQDQITSKKFAPVTLGATVGTPGDVSSGSHTAGDIVMALVGIPPLNMLTSSGDRPIGLVQSDLDRNALPNTAIVLTREIIETALSSSHPPVASAPVIILTPKPGIMVITFSDSGPKLGDTGASYVMALQVERCEGSLLQFCEDGAAQGATTVAPTAPMTTTSPPDSGAPSPLAAATVVPFTPVLTLGSAIKRVNPE